MDNSERTPATFEEAVEYVAQRIEETTVKEPMFHFSGGMAIRNRLGLWDKNSPLHKDMIEKFGLCHADDTGSIIANAAHARKNGIAYDPLVDVALFKAHWRRAGLDPATMNRLENTEEAAT